MFNVTGGASLIFDFEHTVFDAAVGYVREIDMDTWLFLE